MVSLNEGRKAGGKCGTPLPMPPDVQAEFQRRLGVPAPTGAASGSESGVSAPASLGH